MNVTLFAHKKKVSVDIKEYTGGGECQPFTVLEILVDGDELRIIEEGNLDTLKKIHKALHEYLVSGGGNNNENNK